MKGEVERPTEEGSHTACNGSVVHLHLICSARRDDVDEKNSKGGVENNLKDAVESDKHGTVW